MATTTTMAMIVLLLGMAAGQADGQPVRMMSNCNLSDIPVMSNVNVSRLAGRWNLWKVVDIVSAFQHVIYDIGPDVSFTVNGEQKNMVLRKDSRIQQSGTCDVTNVNLQIDQSTGAFTSGYTIQSALAVKIVMYPLATDYTSIAATYQEVFINGVRSDPLSTVGIIVRNSTSHDFSKINATLVDFCGQSAGDPDSDFYNDLAVNTSVTCEVAFTTNP